MPVIPMRFFRFVLTGLLALPGASLAAQGRRPRVYTHADTLRGSNGPDRAWWDATFYDLHVAVSIGDSTISGWNGISYRVLKPGQTMQIDLQEPLVADSMIQDGRRLTFRRDSNAFFVSLVTPQRAGAVHTVTVYYHGKPRAARRPPWDGGLIWRVDSAGHPWVATANEGLGASVWWPNKDYGGDEPDSQRIAITIPDSMQDASNGRLRSVTHHANGTTTYEWFVTEPINNYDVEINAGFYAHFSDLFQGKDGTLTLDFWPLAVDRDTAMVWWPSRVKSMLSCFEYWFGRYPWYPDGYKLIEAPHLGMEHQSGVAYGNGFQNGYLGRDLSRTGTGSTWDFIIVHESAHEWFGNNITAKDQADEWIHEAFANYAENLYVECQDGKAAGAQYVIGTRRLVRNDAPVIAAHRGVNADGSGDMYYKGGNMLHTIRQLVDNDDKWRQVLTGLNQTFWHQTVTSGQIENYISKTSGIDLDKVFAEYLTTTKIPEFEYRIAGDTLSYHWTNVVPGFAMPVKAMLSDGNYTWLFPTEQWKTARLSLTNSTTFALDENFYVAAREAGSP
jgi:aminopeptidase N